jgi:hypothetical protein
MLNTSMQRILVWLLVYLVALSATIGSFCYVDAVSCGKTGDTREWVLQLIAVIVSLLAGNNGNSNEKN